jgi:hypothetical protein
MTFAMSSRACRITAADRSGAMGEFQQSTAEVLPELPNRSQIWSHLRPERRYPEQFLLILTALSKGSEGSRRPPGDGFTDDRGHHSRYDHNRAPRPEVAGYPSARRKLVDGGIPSGSTRGADAAKTGAPTFVTGSITRSRTRNRPVQRTGLGPPDVTPNPLFTCRNRILRD